MIAFPYRTQDVGVIEGSKAALNAAVKHTDLIRRGSIKLHQVLPGSLGVGKDVVGALYRTGNDSVQISTQARSGGIRGADEGQIVDGEKGLHAPAGGRQGEIRGVQDGNRASPAFYKQSQMSAMPKPSKPVRTQAGGLPDKIRAGRGEGKIAHLPGGKKHIGGLAVKTSQRRDQLARVAANTAALFERGGVEI